MDTKPDLLQLGQRILAEQPFSVLLGAELTAFEPGRAELTLPVRREHLHQHGFVHGGAVSYLADNALTYAGGSARASVLYAGKTQAVCRCDVFAVKDGNEKLCATAQGTIVTLGTASE